MRTLSSLAHLLALTGSTSIHEAQTLLARSNGKYAVIPHARKRNRQPQNMYNGRNNKFAR